MQNAAYGYRSAWWRRRNVTKTLLVMKLTSLFLFVCLFQVQANGLSQTVSLTAKDMPLDKVFDRVEKQTGYFFLYDPADLKGTKAVSISVVNMPIVTFLETILKNITLRYTIENNNITVSRKPVPAVVLSLNQQEDPPIKISGIVLGNDNQPLVGATVRVKGKNITTSTNEQGYFDLSLDTGSVLIFSYVGFEEKQVKINNSSTISIILTQSNRILDTTAVYSTGYQRIPKERATGSFVQVDNELFNRSVSTNVLDRLVGVTSGLNFENKLVTLGLKNNVSNINIRGISTINANMKPLIVVDGFPYEEGIGETFNVVVNNINPNDIESLTILKDAAAASIWGARAGNGVIVITTKKGKLNQRTKVQFTSNVNIIDKPDLNYIKTISSADAIQFEKSVFNTGAYDVYDDLYATFDWFPILSPAVEILLAKRRNELTEQEANSKLQALAGYDVRNDIRKYLIQSAVNQQYNVNISGGSQRTSYYGSVGYDKNRTNDVGDKLERLSIRFDNTYAPIKNLEINTFIVYTNTKNTNNNGQSNYQNFLPAGTGSAAPYTRLADDQGRALAVTPSNGYREPYLDTISFRGLLDWYYRPLDELKYNDNISKQSSTRLGAGLKYTIIPGLNAEVKYQYEKSTATNRDYNSLSSYYTRDLINQFVYQNSSGRLIYPIPLGGIMDFTNVEQSTYNIRGQLNYNHKWSHHELAAIAGTEVREMTYESNMNRKYGFDPDTYTYTPNMDYITTYNLRPYENNGAYTIVPGDDIAGRVNRFASYYSNAAYTFREKYILSGSVRIDMSNFFGVETNMKMIPLWSSGLAWNLSNESFYKINWLPYLKIRATYGFSGNLKNDATSLPTAVYQNSNALLGWINSERSVLLATPPNPGLTWEKVRMINWGIDFQIKNNRINGSIEYYTKRGLNLISSIKVDPTTGATSYVGNNASIKGNGVDIVINTVNIKSALQWSTSFLFSWNKDEVIKHTVLPTPGQLVEFPGTPNIGKPLFSIYSQRWEGLDPATGDPRGYDPVTQKASSDYAALNDHITTNDLIYRGPSSSPFFGGFRNTIDWKKISLSFNITYKLGHYFRRSSIGYNKLLNTWGGHADYALRWQKPGDEKITNVPSVNTTRSSATRDGFYLQTDPLVEKADHIRLRDIRISYDLIRSKLKNRPFKQAQLYIYASNLGIIWSANKLDIDPDYGDKMIPPSRSIAVGMNIGF